jgi:hypothetical protein
MRRSFQARRAGQLGVRFLLADTFVSIKIPEVHFMWKLLAPTLLAAGLMAAVNVADVSVFQTGSLTNVALAQQGDAPAADAAAPARTVETRETTWFVDPVWIALAVGVIALVAILFALGSRGGTAHTTIVKD